MEQSETPTRELTLEEAVALAILLQKNEQLARSPGGVSPRYRGSPESSSTRCTTPACSRINKGAATKRSR